MVVLLCLALYLPGFFAMPAIDRDEARFVQASRQMLDADSWHDFVVPMVQDRPRLQKPALIYWLQSASAWVCSGRAFGAEYSRDDAVWMYRVPSLLAAITSCIVTMRLARRIYAPPAAILAGALLACCPVMFWEAHQGRSDMVMLAFTTGSMYLLWRVLESREGHAKYRHVIALWFAVALGVLTKGPVPLMLVVLTLVVFSVLERSWRAWRAVRPFTGALVVLLPISAWVYLLSHEIDLPTYLHNVWRETGGRAASAMEGHGGPAGYHIVVMYAAFFPACMLAIPSAVRAFRRAVHIRGVGWNVIRELSVRHRPEAFLLSLLVPSWIVFETSGTKLPHYTLPLYPVLAILSARMVFAALKSEALRRPVFSLLLHLYAVFTGLLPILALSVGGYMLYQSGLRIDAVGLVGIGLIFGVLYSSACVRFVRHRRFLAAQICGIASMLTAAIPLGYCAGIWPAMQLSRSVATAIEQVDPTNTRPIATVALHEDSMIFETRGRAVRVDEWRLKQWIREHPNAIVVLDERRAPYWSGFAAFARVEGLNYSNGKLKQLVIGEFIPKPEIEAHP